MNQILSVEDKTTKSKPNKAKRTKKGPAEIGKVTRVFCIITILFGLVLTGQGVYAIVNNFNPNTNGSKNEDQDVSIESNTNTGKVTISGKVPNGVQKITYKWNEEDEETINKNGEKDFKEEIDLPVGNNKLTVTIVDSKNNSTPYTKEFTADATLPQLALSLSEDGSKVKIIAKDTEALSYVTYQWDDGDVQTIYPDDTSKAQLEKDIDAIAGQHTLTVVAVNTNNKTTTKKQEVDGASKPEVGATIDQTDKSKIKFSASDENGLKNLSFTINGQEYVLPANGNQKQMEYTFEVKQGHYAITVAAENIYGLKESKDFLYDY